MAEVVLLEVCERIATVTLNRPEVRNALSSEVLTRLPQLLREADQRDDVDVLILTGADPAFCAGLDLKELGSAQGRLGSAAAQGGEAHLACSPNADRLRATSCRPRRHWPSASSTTSCATAT